MKGKVIFNMKTNNGFYLANYLILGKFLEIREGKKQFSTKKERALIRGMNHLAKQIRTFVVRLDNFRDEIISGEVTYEPVPKEKGGEIVFRINSTKEKVEQFCRYRIRDKAAALPMKALMSIKREVDEK